MIEADGSSWDVAVIGAGVIGAATAYYLARSGYSVVILDQGEANRQGSGTTAGNVHVQAIHPRRPAQMVSADVGRFLPLQVAARDLWEHLEEELGRSLEFNCQGGLMVAETPEEAADLRTKRALEARCGLSTEIISSAEARTLLPLLSEGILAADWCPSDGYANPLLVTPAYVSAAVTLGATVLSFTKVDGIASVGADYKLTTGRTSIRAHCIVNAAGPWIREVGLMMGVDMAVSATPIQMHLTRRVPKVMNLLVQHIGQALSVKQVAAGNILVGGGWPADQLQADGRYRASVRSIRANLQCAGRVLPLIRDCELLRTWAGPLAVTADEMPVVGSIPGRPNCFVAGGTYGFTLAPLWGQCLSALIEGQEAPVDLAGLGPERLM